jgi:iron complex transport system substrate-binding protein
VSRGAGRTLAIAAALLACHTMPARAERVVSLNLCTDQFLVLLAPEKVAGLTILARDPALSVVATQAAHMPVVRADAEAVLALRPDLVLAARWGAQTTLAALERQGVRVVRSLLPQDFPQIRAETARLADLLGEPARGAALLARMDARLAAVPPATGIAAVWLAPRGYAAGPDSLEAAVLRAAGLDPVGRGRQLGLEALLAHPPALLVLADAPQYPSLATDLLAHPALAALPRRRVPAALLACGGPWTAEAVALLARAP